MEEGFVNAYIKYNLYYKQRQGEIVYKQGDTVPKNATKVIFDSSVAEIPDYAFRCCPNLREVILNEGLQRIGVYIFEDCPLLECAKFPSVSKRIRSLLEAGQTEIEDKIIIYQHFEWRGDELLVSPEAFRNQRGVKIWGTTRRNLNELLAWISYFELREATTTIELAVWKFKIEEAAAKTEAARDGCRCEIPGPAKDAIIKYYG